MVTKILTYVDSSWADIITTTEPMIDTTVPTTAEDKRIWDAVTASTKRVAVSAFADAAKFSISSTPRSTKAGDWFREQYLTEPLASAHTVKRDIGKIEERITGLKMDKVWIDELTDTASSAARSKWFTGISASSSSMPTYTPPIETPEAIAARALRSRMREEHDKQRARSCEGVKTVRPHLVGRLRGRRSSNTELLSEILNNANFHREQYGYARHQQYQHHLDGLIRDWDASLHDELLAHVRTLPVTEHEISNDTFGLESPSVVPVPVKVKSDPIDHMPEEWVRDLTDQAVRSAKAVW